MTALTFAPLPDFDPATRHRVYLGLDPAAGYEPCWSTGEDSVGVVGPPRYGKSSGILLPTLMTWAGPVVCTSTRGDLLGFSGNRRRQIAAAAGGDVYVYDPFGSEPGVTSLRWSPLAGCTDPTVAYRRAGAMVAVTGQGITDGAHWRAGAAVILRTLLHAAALADVDMAQLRRWLAEQETLEPSQILDSHHSAARGWGADLRAMDRLGDRERGSFYSVARTCIDATAEPRVLASTAAVDFDVDAFLRTNSTLFIVGPSHYQAVAAPLVVGLVDAIAQRAAEMAATMTGGKLASPLLLCLDEVANIAPLESLPSLVSEGGGRGIVTMWAAQSFAQLRTRYGADGQQAILTATTAKVIFGGMSNGADLRDVSGWAGEYREPQITLYAGGADPRRTPTPGSVVGDEDVSRQHAIGGLYRPALPIEAIQQLPPLHAWLWYRSDPPLLVQTRPAGLIEPLQRLAGWTPDPPP